jgi:hypothetical protein
VSSNDTFIEFSDMVFHLDKNGDLTSDCSSNPSTEYRTTSVSSATPWTSAFVGSLVAAGILPEGTTKVWSEVMKIQCETLLAGDISYEEVSELLA